MATLDMSVQAAEAPCHSGAVPGDKDRSLCRLIHDARNHLNALTGLSLVLGISSTHPKADLYRGCLESEAQQLADLLELIRANLAGQAEMPLQSECFNAVEHLKLVAHASQPLAERVGIHIEVSAPDQLPLVKGRPCLIKRMLTNLLSNAIQHSKATRIHLTLAAQPSACGSSLQLSYRVSDNGVGFPSSLSATACSVTQKHGHGLAICHQLASDLGAKFELHAAEPCGVTASVDLSLEQDKGAIS